MRESFLRYNVKIKNIEYLKENNFQYGPLAQPVHLILQQVFNIKYFMTFIQSAAGSFSIILYLSCVDGLLYTKETGRSAAVLVSSGVSAELWSVCRALIICYFRSPGYSSTLFCPGWCPCWTVRWECQIFPPSDLDSLHQINLGGECEDSSGHSSLGPDQDQDVILCSKHKGLELLTF